MAIENMRRIFPTVEYFGKARDALQGTDACLVMTEWDEFKQLDSEFEAMKEKIVIDGRKVINSKKVDYEGLCW
jgi:UDPglucose 6-dehydrogenase